MTLVTQAVIFAAQAHDGAARKGSEIPYIVHPMEVVAIASTMTDDPQVLAAAALTASTSGAMLLCVLELQGARGLSPLHAGALFAPFNLAVISGSLLGPRVVRAVGPGAAMAAGLGGIWTAQVERLGWPRRGAASEMAGGRSGVAVNFQTGCPAGART